MRKLFTLLLCLTFFAATPALAQDILNNSFEYWSNHSRYEVPDVIPPTSEIIQSNNESFDESGILTMTRISGAEGDAMQLQTKEVRNGQDTTMGYFIWGGEPVSTATQTVFTGGFPFSDPNVSSLKADLRYRINANSPGLILIQFKKNGVPIGGGNTPASLPGLYAYFISGEQSSFTTMDFPISPALSVTPDTVVIAFTSNNVFDANELSFPGNFLDLDNIRFEGTTQAIPGGNLNSWKMLPPVELPFEWSVMMDNQDIYDIKSSDATHGMSSLHLESRFDSHRMEKRIARASLGTIEGYNGGTNYIGGMQIHNKPAMFSLNYKMSGHQADTATVRAIFLKYDAINNVKEEVGSAYIRLPLSPVWERVGVNVIYYTPDVIPDSVIIEINGASWMNNNPYAELWVDNLQLHYCEDAISIFGQTSLCVNASGVKYYVEKSWPGSSYTWQVPAGASIVAGDGTDTITVNFGTTFGQISVTQSYADGCTADFAVLDVTEATSSSASAHAPLYVCAKDPIQLEGFIMGAAGGTWSGGDGSFSDVNDMFAIYYPGLNDEMNGSVTLTLTTYGGGNCGEASDNTSVTILPRPAPNAGEAFVVCEDVLAISLNGTTNPSATQTYWFSDGDGAFNDAASLNTTYNLGTMNDMSAANITFTLSASNLGCTEQDYVTVLRQELPNPHAGPDDVICAGDVVHLSGMVSEASSAMWTGGSGSFDDASSLTAKYTPSTEDIANGSVTFTLYAFGLYGCPTVTDISQVTLPVCTGNSTAEAAKVKAYPNPASGQLLVETEESVTAENIILMDQYSQVLINTAGSGQITKVDVSGLPAGVYVLITTVNGTQKIQKVVIE